MDGLPATLTTPSRTVSFSAGAPSFSDAEAQEFFARCCGRLTYLRSGALDGSTAGGRRLVDGLLGIAHIDFDFSPRNIQLFGGDLGQRGLDAGAEFYFAGKDGYRAVLTYGDPGIELSGIGFSARRVTLSRRGPSQEERD